MTEQAEAVLITINVHVHYGTLYITSPQIPELNIISYSFGHAKEKIPALIEEFYSYLLPVEYEWNVTGDGDIEHAEGQWWS